MGEGSAVASGNFAIDFMLGGVSAAVSKTLTAPIERVKLILQNQDSIESVRLTGRRYTGIGNCFYRVATEEGVMQLWRGNFANVVRYFPTQALNFAFKDFYKRTFNPYKPKEDPFKFFLGNIMSGGAAGATSLCVVYPLDFCRTRLANDMGKGAADRQFSGPVDVFQKIIKSDGVAGLYRGFGISVLGIIAYRGCYFGMFDSGKVLILRKEATIFEKFIFAQFVTGAAGVASYPLDTVRRRLMMMSGKKAADSKVTYYNGTLDCFRKVYAEEGTKGFFKGALSNFFRGIGAALVLTLYDKFQVILYQAAGVLPKK